MKLAPRDQAGFFARPEPGRAGVLIYGQDAMRVALKRQELIAALTGPNAEEEMRLTRLAPSELRGDAAALLDELKAGGFFPGPRVVHVDEATDTAAPAILAALEDWAEGDATLVVTAGALKPSSKIRKAFEAHKNAYAAAIYDNPPTRAEIEAELSRAGLTDIAPDASAALTALAQALDPGDFRQTLEKVALYKLGDSSPLSADEVHLCAPATQDAELDEMIHAVAEGNADRVGPLMARLSGQGVNAVTLCISVQRHFAMLHRAASDPEGVGAGIGRLRPPLYGPRRDRAQRQAQSWGMHRLESALTTLTDTDLKLRSTQNAPDGALLERALIRIAMLARR